MCRNSKKDTEGLNAPLAGQIPAAGTGPIGALRDDAEILDRIVDDAMRSRRISAWLPGKEDFAALVAMTEETGRSLHELLDEALRLLLRQWRQEQAERNSVESLLIQGLDSGPATPMTTDDWDAVKQEGQRLIDERKTQRPR